MSKSLITITENGYAKRTSVEDYNTQSKHDLGQISLKQYDLAGPVVDCCIANETHESVIISTAKGIAIRLRIGDIPLTSRNCKPEFVFNIHLMKDILCSVVAV